MKKDSGPDWNALLVRVGSHQDKAAFGALFSHFAPLLKGFLLKGGGVEPEQAEELVQETMIKVWRKAPSYAPAQAAASTWMYTMAEGKAEEVKSDERVIEAYLGTGRKHKTPEQERAAEAQA